MSARARRGPRPTTSRSSDRAAPRRGRTGFGGPGRLRQVRDVARPADGAAAVGVGVRPWCWPARGTCSCVPVLSMDQQAWTAAHVAAFEFFDGAPARLVPDNLRTGVERADLYDPRLNRAYGELAEHYGMLIDPAQGRTSPGTSPGSSDPCPMSGTRSGGVDRSTSLAQMQDDALRWCLEVAGARGHREPGRRRTRARCSPRSRRPTVIVAPGAVRAGRLVAPEGRPGLHQGRQDPLLGALAADRAACRRPRHRHHGRRSSTTASWSTTHVAKPRGKQTDTTDYPPEKIAFHMRTPTGCREHGRRDRARLCSRSASCSRSTPCSGCAPRRECSGWPTGTARPGWKRPARWRCRWVTRPTAPSRASWSPAPNTNPPPGPPVTAAPASAD